jgi:hypothetical protein
MPETAMGIKLNGDGLCQLCKDYKEFIPMGEQELRKEIARYVNGKTDCNCIVPLSGGRDSSYALYYAKEILGLRPLAVHNDNDFETEIATKNLEVITKCLNVPLICVNSENHITRKIVAEKFKMNAPFGVSLVVDQTCEACKYGFESATYNTARKKCIELIIWGDSKDESTEPYHKLIQHKTPTKLQRLLSPNVFNIFKYKHYFNKMKKEYGSDSPQGLKEIHLYDYIRWDQKVIVDTIQEKLGWSVPEGSPTTWRVDCSLVPLVNYLTEKAYGVSKIELGFSNMVRSGKMDRDDALKRVEQIKKNTSIDKLKTFLQGMNISRAVIDRVL